MTQTAPGKAHREGISLKKLMAMFSTEEKARKWIEAQIWPDGPYCPHCGSKNVQHPIKHKTMTHRCRDCPKRPQFSLKTGTIMQSSNLGYRDWAIAIYLLTTNLKGVSAMKLHRDLEIAHSSAWHLAHRLRAAFGNEQKRQFDGPVEADETYIGGKRKNMSNARRRELKGTGRGGSGKAVVVGIKDRKTGRIIAQQVLQVDTLDVAGFVAAMTSQGAVVYTDEAAVYNILKRWYDHDSVKHSVSEYVRDQVHTNGIESFWAMLKRGYNGTYHKMSPKHLDRYVSEFAGRHNIRELDTSEQMRTVVLRMRNKRLRYSDLIAENGLESGARS
ncbi:MAG: IS1595 family transposase [Rhodospirillales bacterium]|nr:IS1595 family transposase [Rhodospirillales bacterium]